MGLCGVLYMYVTLIVLSLTSLQYGLTPLMGASSEGRVESLQLLLDRGAQVNLQDEVSAVGDRTNVCCCHVPLC